MQEMDTEQIISANKCKISTVAQGSKKRHSVLGEVASMEVFDLVREPREGFLEMWPSSQNPKDE